MKIRLVVTDFLYSSLKVMFCVICYVVTLLFAICSGYFTIIFYASGQTETNQLIIGLLAGLFEFIKFVLAIAYPFMAYRNFEVENRVRRILVVALFMSILSSLYFFLDSGDIIRSPASKIISLIYSYIPMLEILPLKFSQFISTMSLSIIIEVLIIKIPSIAPIFYLKKDYSRKKSATTNWDKLRDVFISIPNRFIDRLYDKYLYDPEEKITVAVKDNVVEVKDYPEQSKYLADKNPLLISPTESNNETTRAEGESTDYSNLDNQKENKKDNKIETSGHTKYSDMLNYLKIMYENSKDNISISQAQLSELTGFSELKVKSIRKVLKELGILKTSAFKTYILVDYESAIKKFEEEGMEDEKVQSD